MPHGLTISAAECMRLPFKLLFPGRPAASGRDPGEGLRKNRQEMLPESAHV